MAERGDWIMRTYEVLSRPRYYRAQGGDYLVVVGLWREEGRITRYDGAASIQIGQSRWVSGWEFDRFYLKNRCRRVTSDVVPAEWHRSLDRYGAVDLVDVEAALVKGGY